MRGIRQISFLKRNTAAKGVFSSMRREFLRILLLYALVALLFAGICVPIYFYADKLFVERELQQYQTLLERSAGELSREIVSIRHIAFSTRSDRAFRSLWLQTAEEQSLSDMMRQRDMLRDRFNQLYLTADAGIVFGDDLVLTGKWTFYPGTSLSFYPHMLQCDSLGFENWHTMLALNTPGFLPAADYQVVGLGPLRAVTYTVQWGTEGLMYALLSEERLCQLFLPEDLPNARVTLQKDDGTLLFAAGELQTEERTPYTLSAPVISCGATASITVSRDTISRTLHPLRNRVILYLACLFLAAVLLTLLFACFTAIQPLRSLSRRLPGSHRLASEGISLLPGSYGMLLRGIDSMDQTIATQRETMAQSHLDLALVRGFLSNGEKKRFGASFPNFPHSYRLLLYRLAPGSVSAEAMRRMAELSRAAFPEAVLYPLDRGGLLIIFDIQRNTQEQAAALLGEMRAEPEMQVCAFASDVQTGIDALHTAWLQLMDIENCVSCTQSDAIRTSRDLPEKRAVMPLSLQDLQTLYNALSSGNQTLALSILENCTGLLRRQEENALLYHHVYLLVQDILRQIQLENPLSLHTLTIPVWSWDERETLFSERLPAFFAQVCSVMRDSRTAAADRSSEAQVLSYICERLSSPELCVDSVADHFDISRTTLQKLCRNATGMSVAAYIEMQRLGRAYTMLAQRDASVAQVAEACGWSSANSFYKAFRHCYGHAPRAVGEEKAQESGAGPDGRAQKTEKREGDADEDI